MYMKRVDTFNRESKMFNFTVMEKIKTDFLDSFSAA